jgi:hypothetical protein
MFLLLAMKQKATLLVLGLTLTIATIVSAMGTATTLGAIQNAHAAPSQVNSHGTCLIGEGNHGQGASGCAGNVGGFIETRNGCRNINEGPFNQGKHSC